MVTREAMNVAEYADQEIESLKDKIKSLIDRPSITIGTMTIYKDGDIYMLETNGGEAMEIPETDLHKFEKILSDYYNENF